MDNKERRYFQAVQAKNRSGSNNPFGFYHSGLVIRMFRRQLKNLLQK